VGPETADGSSDALVTLPMVDSAGFVAAARVQSPPTPPVSPLKKRRKGLLSLSLDELHVTHKGGMAVMPIAEFTGLATVIKGVADAFDKATKPVMPDLTAADEEKLVCPFCGKTGFGCKKGLRKHYRTAHSSTERFFCGTEGCERSYADRRSRDAHDKTWGSLPLPHEVVKTYRCKVPGCTSVEVFTAPHQVASHHKLVHPKLQGTFVCSHCGVMKATKKALQDHATGCAKDPANPKIPCGFAHIGCRRSFRRARDFNFHMRTAHNCHKGQM
jgi:hypothetical protein